MKSTNEKILELSALFDAGKLTEREFNALKDELPHKTHEIEEEQPRKIKSFFFLYLILALVLFWFALPGDKLGMLKSLFDLFILIIS